LVGAFHIVTAEPPAKQIAALPYRKRQGALEVMLVSSRESKRWVIPKGWPMQGRADFNAAKIEALEEGGVTGRVKKTKIGSYSYHKKISTGAQKHCRVDVYLLEVKIMLRQWKEKHERARAWFGLDAASNCVAEAELKEIILRLAP
jgi:8-oxo-dGTP pyrophosphatase MutT (NUDIX family)